MLQYTHAMVEGQKIAYATEGSGPALLLLHGLGFDHREWAMAAPYLAGHFRLLIPDLPGFGESRQATWDGTPETITRTIAGFLTIVQAVPAFIAGTGLGGTLTLALATRYPERVQAAIISGAPAINLWPNTSQGRLLKRLASVPGALALFAQMMPERHASQLLHDSYGSAEPPAEAIAIVSAILRDQLQRQTLVRAISQLDSWESVMRRLGGIRAPTMLLWGERDALYGLPSAERLRHAINGAQLVSLAGAGHTLALERPADLAAAIRQFLAPALQKRR